MVEWKKLGEVISVHTGGQLNRNDMIEDGLYPVVNGGRDYSGYTNSYNEKANSITISQGGESAGYVNWIITNFWAGAHCYVIEDNGSINKRYLFHTLKNKERDLQQSKQGAGIPGLNRNTLYKLNIPIPSLSEQQRIVGILDTFTASIDNLKEQIALRRKQYNWLLDKLYYSNKAELLKAKESGNVDVKTLDEIGTFIRGKRFVRTDVVPEGVPCIHYGDMYTYYGVWAEKTPTHLTKEVAEKLRFAQKGNVIIVGAGENDIDIGVGVAWLGDEDVVVHDACYIFKHDMNPKYLSYFMRSMNYHLQIRMGVVDGKICSISAKELGRTLIPVPSLPEQQRIVSILDTFEASIQNLEAQLKQREKQDEYYRNKLLTFE